MYNGAENKYLAPTNMVASGPHRPVTSLRSFSILHTLPLLMALVWTCYMYNSQDQRAVKEHQKQDCTPAQDLNEPIYNREEACCE